MDTYDGAAETVSSLKRWHLEGKLEGYYVLGSLLLVGLFYWGGGCRRRSSSTSSFPFACSGGLGDEGESASETDRDEGSPISDSDEDAGVSSKVITQLGDISGRSDVIGLKKPEVQMRCPSVPPADVPPSGDPGPVLIQGRYLVGQPPSAGVSLQGQVGSMNDESFDDAVAGLLERVDAHEKGVEHDAGRPRGLQGREDRSAPPSNGTPLVASLEESFRDIRECARNTLRGYREDVTWTLPAGARARVAPGMLAQIYRSGRLYENYVNILIKQRGLDGCPLATEWMRLAILIDRAVVEGSEDWVNLKSTELAMRRVYGIERALENVRQESDWRQP